MVPWEAFDWDLIQKRLSQLPQLQQVVGREATTGRQDANHPMLGEWRNRGTPEALNGVSLEWYRKDLAYRWEPAGFMGKSTTVSGRSFTATSVGSRSTGGTSVGEGLEKVVVAAA